MATNWERNLLAFEFFPLFIRLLRIQNTRQICRRCRLRWLDSVLRSQMLQSVSILFSTFVTFVMLPNFFVFFFRHFLWLCRAYNLAFCLSPFLSLLHAVCVSVENLFAIKTNRFDDGDISIRHIVWCTQ